MTTYNEAAVSDTAIAFQKGITLQQGRALRDNPKASAEGAVDADIIAAGWHPYDAVMVGDGATGQFYSGASASEIVTPDYADGYEYRIFFMGLVPALTGRDLEIQHYLETSATYAGGGNLAVSVSSVNGVTGEIEIRHPRLSRRSWPAIASAIIDGGATTFSNLVNLGVTAASSQKVLRSRFRFINSAANVAGGAAYLYRRRIYGPAF